MAAGDYWPGPAAVRKGWQCPGCQVSYSPDVDRCTCQARPAVNLTVNATVLSDKDVDLLMKKISERFRREWMRHPSP